MLEIRLLGELEVRRGGARVPLPPSKRTRALLSYLVATARPHSRAHLCDLLWDSPDDPRAALRWSLAKLRPLIDDAGAVRLQADRERVAFESADGQVDLARARALGSDPAAAATAALREVAALFRGELLEGLELPDCYRYHQWLLAERESARSLRTTVLRTLVARLAGSPDEALAHARAWVAAEPLHEPAHVAVINVLGALRRTREALAQYDDCRRILETELRARPSPELERARRALGPPPPATAPAVTPSASLIGGPPAAPDLRASAATTPLVGREREKAVLESAVGEAVGGGGPMLLLTGEPGIGKTRLLDALAEDVGRAGGRVLRGRAYEAEAVRPYGAWIDALRSLPLGEAAFALRADLATLLPELGMAPAAGDRNRLFDAVVRLLRRLGEEAPPLAVLLDDVHWLDEASAALVHFATRALGGAPVLFAAAARPGELLDNPAALRLARALAREGQTLEMPVLPLAPAETADLARAIAPGIDPARVVAESQGHPLLAVEVARALERGQDTLSETLAGLLGERLDRLEAAGAELLPWMAALGRRFDLRTLELVTGTEAGALLAALESLERHRVLREAPEGGEPGYDFVHDLVRKAAYRRLSEPRRRLVHGRIARALQSCPDPEGTRAADVAHHAALGGEDALCASACVAAGQRCLRLFAHAEAAALSERGLARLGRLLLPDRLRLRGALLRLRIHSAMTMEEAARLEPALKELIREAQEAGVAEAARVALDALTFVHWYRGDLGGAHAQTLRFADAARSASSEETARGLSATARCLAHLERDLERAESLLHEARLLAEDAGAELLDIMWATGLLYHHQGEYELAGSFLQRALTLGRRAQDRYCEWDCQARLTMLELERGRPEEALARCEALEPLVSRMSEGSEPAFSVALRALARAALGVEGADHEVDKAAETLRQLDSKWMLAYTLTSAAFLDLEQERFEPARRHAESALLAAEAVDRRSEAALARAALARLALRDGNLGAARAHLEAESAHLAQPRVLSARARAGLGEVARTLGLSIPTVATTVPTTPSA